MYVVLLGSGRPGKVTEWGNWVLRHLCRQHWFNIWRVPISMALISAQKTVRREIHGMVFHGQAAACKPHITKYNAIRQMSTGAVETCSVKWQIMLLCLAVWIWFSRRTLPAWLHCANCKVW